MFSGIPDLGTPYQVVSAFALAKYRGDDLRLVDVLQITRNGHRITNV